MSSDVLDDPQARRQIDPRGMLASIAGLPQQCRDAWQAAQAIELPRDYSEVERIVVLGMGGSAISGDFLRVLLQRESAVPVFNVRQYDLPPYVDERTLVIASSFSGNTEETLSTFDQALSLPAKKLAITAGGRLLTTARANGIPVFTYEFHGEPRAALGWGLMSLLAVAGKLGLMQGVERDVLEAIAVMEAMLSEIGEDAPTERNAAKQLARALHEKLPVIYGAGPLTEVAHRWKTQLNESSKVWCFYEELPELHHNATVGIELPTAIAQATAVVLLRSNDLVHRRVRLRYEFTQQLLEKAGVTVIAVDTRGESALAQMMSLILFGDYVSGYLGILYGVDPTPTAVIEELRNFLAAQK
jgi:glucose/mannose-6-phosphate isomerase